MVSALSRGLLSAGVRVWLAYPRTETYAHRFAELGVGLLPYSFTGKLGALRLGELAGAFRPLGRVVAHSHNRRADFACALTARFSLGLPTVSTQHGEINLDRRTLRPRNDLPAMTYRYLLGRAFDRLVAPSEYMVRQVRRMALRRVEGRVRVIYNGIDGEKFGRGSGKGLRASLRIPAKARVVSFIGAIDKKGHGQALSAVARLVERGVDAHLLVVGEGPKKGEAQETARLLGIAQRVHFLGFRTDIPDILSASDIFIHPSMSEGGLPLSIMEAMAAGVPVVASTAGGTPELVEGNVDGLLVPVGEVPPLVEALLSLIKNPALARRLTDAGKRKIMERFTTGNMVRAYLELYRELGLEID